MYTKIKSGPVFIGAISILSLMKIRAAAIAKCEKCSIADDLHQKLNKIRLYERLNESQVL